MLWLTALGTALSTDRSLHRHIMMALVLSLCYNVGQAVQIRVDMRLQINENIMQDLMRCFRARIRSIAAYQGLIQLRATRRGKSLSLDLSKRVHTHPIQTLSTGPFS